MKGLLSKRDKIIWILHQYGLLRELDEYAQTHSLSYINIAQIFIWLKFSCPRGDRVLSTCMDFFLIKQYAMC